MSQSVCRMCRKRPGLFARQSSKSLMALLMPLMLASCNEQLPRTGMHGAQSELLQAQKDHLKRVEVTVEAPVSKLLEDDREGIPHQRFLIRLADGSTVLIAHDTNMAPRVPLHKGDLVRVHGEFIWTPRGGLIHWTHHSDSPMHASGWIDCNGQRYQ